MSNKIKTENYSNMVLNRRKMGCGSTIEVVTFLFKFFLFCVVKIQKFNA
jgi:hypothetical protein